MILRLATHAMGTRFELALPVVDGAREADVRAAGEAALEEIELCDRRLSRFRRDSLVAHVEREAHRAPVRLDDDTFELFALCARVHAESGGAFDVTVGGWMDALGFHGRGSGGARPDAGALVLAAEARTLALRDPGVRLDLGAVGKGHALDLAVRALREAGVRCAFVHGGTSTAFGVGAPPGERGWRVAIAGTRAVAVLRDRALSVSAAHGRTLAGDGARGHVLDPRARAPERAHAAAGPLAVVARSAAVADAWSTALLVDASARPSDSLTRCAPPADVRGAEPALFRFSQIAAETTA